jgi:hypothetical protein
LRKVPPSFERGTFLFVYSVRTLTIPVFWNIIREIDALRTFMRNIALLALIVIASQASAVIIAQDVASNYTSGSSYMGQNMGTGFNAWSLIGTTTPAAIIRTSSLNGTGTSIPNVDTAGVAFGNRLTNSTGPAGTVRTINYANPAQINLVKFSVDIGTSLTGSGISVERGHYMTAQFGGARFGVAYLGNYTGLRFVNDTGSLTTVASILPHTSTRIDVQVFKVASNQVQVKLTDALSGFSETKLFTNNSTGNFSQFQFINDQTGTSVASEAFANNLEVHANAVVPEPATMAVVGLGAVGLIRRRRKSM